MATDFKRVWSNTAIPPGNLLKREIEFRGISRNQLARLMDRTPDEIDDIIEAKTYITPSIADDIEKAIGIKAYFWTGLETTYRATLAHNEVVAREGPTHDCDLGHDCPSRQTYEDDDEDYIYDEEPSSASILMDEGENPLK